MNIRKQRALDIIGGQERITPDLAAKALGRTNPNTLGDHGLTIGDDGMAASAEVLRTIDAMIARNITRRRTGGLNGRFDAAVSLERENDRSWQVRLPWGLAGWISATAYAGAPLARPAPVLGVWLAEWPVAGDDELVEVAGAVSARAAQVILARRHPQVVLPDWADEVRPLDHDLALAAQQVAECKRTGEPIPDDTGLTEWELAEISPTTNPKWSAWERSRLTRGESWVLDNQEQAGADAGQVRTPGGLALQTAGNPLQEVRWSTKAVASELEVKESTVRSYLSRGQMPAPDGRDENDAPWWLPTTIREWRGFRSFFAAQDA